MNITGYPSKDKPWCRYYSQDALNAKLPETTIYNYIYEANKEHLDDTSLLFFGKKVSYRKLFIEIANAAKALVSVGVKPGDNIAICMPAIPETIYIIFAANRLGANVCMLNPCFTEEQLTDRLKETEAAIFITVNEFYQKLQPVINKVKPETLVCCSVVNSLGPIVKFVKKVKKIPNALDWYEFIRSGHNTDLPEVFIPEHDLPAIMVYSSGTTGASKGIQLTNYSVNATILDSSEVFLEMQRGDKFFIQIPVWFSTGISVTLLVAMYYGLTAIMEPIYDFEIFYEHIKKYRPNYLITATSLIDWLMEKKNYCKAYADFKCLAVGGEYITPQAEKRCNEWLAQNGNKIMLQKGYGMCELGGTTTAASVRYNVVGSAGLPMPHVMVSAFDLETGKELNYGQRGELRVISPCTMSGYYKHPDETAKFFHKDEKGQIWACTGDMGYISEDGNVFVDGRLSDSYTDKNGSTIYLFDIERTVLSIAQVRQCKVVAMEYQGEIIAVPHIVLLSDNDTDEVISKIHEACINNLAENHIPKYYALYTDALPVSLSGKFDTAKMKNSIELLKQFK